MRVGDFEGRHRPSKISATSPRNDHSMKYLTHRATWAVAILICYWAWLCYITHRPNFGVGAGIPNLDKVLHFGAYGLLTLLACFAVHCITRVTPWLFLYIFTIVSCYGAVDELGQLLVTGRNADLLDWASDVLGAMVAIGGFVTLRYLKERVFGSVQPSSPVEG